MQLIELKNSLPKKLFSKMPPWFFTFHVFVTFQTESQKSANYFRRFSWIFTVDLCQVIWGPTSAKGIWSDRWGHFRSRGPFEMKFRKPSEVHVFEVSKHGNLSLFSVAKILATSSRKVRYFLCWKEVYVMGFFLVPRPNTLTKTEGSSLHPTRQGWSLLVELMELKWIAIMTSLTQVVRAATLLGSEGLIYPPEV